MKPRLKPLKEQPDEMGDGARGASIRGLPCEEVTETKMGDDGVEETHISYNPRRPKSVFLFDGKLGERLDRIFKNQ